MQWIWSQMNLSSKPNYPVATQLSCVALGKQLSLSEPQSPSLRRRQFLLCGACVKILDVCKFLAPVRCSVNVSSSPFSRSRGIAGAPCKQPAPQRRPLGVQIFGLKLSPRQAQA